jgi:hypothetical protein
MIQRRQTSAVHTSAFAFFITIGGVPFIDGGGSAGREKTDANDRKNQKFFHEET